MKKVLTNLGKYDVLRPMGLLFSFSALGAVCLAFPAFAKGQDQPLLVIGVGLLLIGASALVGGSMGFLFGVPRSNDPTEIDDPNDSAAEEKQGTEELHRPNNSLEHVTDWLTKIIVGVGLVQIKEIIGLLDSIGTELGPTFAEGIAGKAIVIAIIVHYVLIGFLQGYLMSYLWLPRAFKVAFNKSHT